MKNSSQTLSCKKLHSREEFRKFVEIYHDKKGVQTSIEYLNKCATVRVFEDTNGDWKGGYCVNERTSLRYLEPFDTTLKRRILKDKELLENDMAEITQIWMNREILVDNINRMNIYLSSMQDALLTQKPIIIGGSKVASVWKSYELVMPHELYFGLVPFSTGNELGKIVYNTHQGLQEELRKKLPKYI